MTEDDFKNHALWAEVKRALDELRKTQADAAPGQTAARERIRWIASHVQKFRKSDFRMFTTGMLQDAQQHWTNVAAHASSIPSNEAYLDDALSAAEASLPLIASWPPASARQGGAGKTAEAFFEQYREEAEAALGAVVARNAELQTELVATEEKVAELTALLGEHEAAVKATTERIDTKVATIESDAADAETDRGEKFTTWLEERQTELVDEKAQPILDEVAAKRDSVQAVLDDVTQMREKAEKATSKAAEAVLARNYGSYANREYVVGVVAYVLGFLLLGGFGLYLIQTVGAVERNVDVSWQYVGLKFGLTVTFAGAAAVAFRFGGQALKRASTNKRVELELRAIVPFLEDLSDEKAAAAKIAFVERMFGRAWEEQARSGRRQPDIGELAAKVAEGVNRGNSAGTGA